jgi:hypothetical protein
LTQNAAQGHRERQADVRIDRHLGDAVDVVLDGVFRGDDFVRDFVQLVEGGIKGGGLAGAGRAGDQHDAVGLADQLAEPLLLPVTAFIRLRISAPEPIRHFYLLEASVSERPFARPQRLFSFENHRSEVKAPDLSLRRNSELFFQPVRPSAPTLDGVRHASGDIRRRKPVAVSRAQNSQTSIQPSLPFRTFVPPDRSAGWLADSDATDHMHQLRTTCL